MTSVVNIAGVEIDLAKVPDRDEPAGSHLRPTGESYELEDGTPVACVDIVSGPHRG